MHEPQRPWGLFALVLFFAAALLHRALTAPGPPVVLAPSSEVSVPGVIPLGPAPPHWQALLDGEGVDVNAAPERVLQQLPGIGPRLSARIVRERQRRPFVDAQDLSRVRGLGPRSVAKLRPHLRFGTQRGSP